MVSQNLKNKLKPIVYKISKYIPSLLISNLIFYFPKLIRIIGPDQEVITHRYLGNIKARTNIKYRIEGYMLCGFYEPDTLAIFNKFIKRNNICLDIGANVGALSLAMAKLVGKNGRVYSFEPGPRNYERLSFNIKLNKGFDKIIQPIKKGVSNTEGNLYWEEEIHNPGNAVLKNNGNIEVPITTIDNFFNNLQIPRLDFVKIDVEGMELEVLQGGIETWKVYEPIFYFESMEPFRFREENDNTKKDVFYEIESFFKSINYSLYNINDLNKIVKTTYLHLSNNTLALKDGLKIKEF